MVEKVTIEYCVPCRFEKQAEQLAEEIKVQFSKRISHVDLVPTQSVGNFEVSLGNNLIYSKKKTGRLPHPGEVEQLIMMRIFN